MTTKLYCYVDETGQDTQGRLFIAGVVLVGEEREAYRHLCEQAERESGKGVTKWMKAGHARKRDYMRRIVGYSESVGRLFFAVFRDTREYQMATAQAVALVIQEAEDYGLSVFVDALPQALEIPLAAELRRAGVRVKKVRGLEDRSDALIRLADAMCGLARATLEGQADMQEIMDSGVKAGAIKRLN